MDKQQAQKIIDGLRAASSAGTAEELLGVEATDFGFLKDKEVLAAFHVKGETPFFVSVSVRKSGVCGFAVYEKRKGNPIFGTQLMSDAGIVWKYKPTKWTGDNQARKKAFEAAAQGTALTFPLPGVDIDGFRVAINQALELRRKADAEGGADDEDATWQPPAPVLPPRSKLPPSRLGQKTVPGVVWQLCATEHGATLLQLQHAIDELDLENPHPATGMLARYATHHGCTVAVHGTGVQATYTLRPPEERPSREGPSEGRSGLDFEDILDQLRGESLSFSAELVASYLLALQAKRFVLLTGISGTGKTQLALEVARAFDEAASADDESHDAIPDEYVLEVRPYHRKYARFIVPAELAQEFDALTNPETKQLELRLPNGWRAEMTISKRTDNSSMLAVLLSGKTREWFMENLQLGEQFQLSRQVEGGRERLDLEKVDAGKRTRPPVPAGRTYAAIAVRPNWTDKTEILGFYNPLTTKYQSTKVLNFLLRAHAEARASDAPRPYFLVFDEMNLARVEHYFSDFLSVMESGDAIDLHDDPQLEDSQGIPRQLVIPKNLFVIGTVNIDETTYMFSPKVLDRAFVLEFNDVNLDGIGRTIDAEEADSTPLALTRFERLEMRGKPTEGEWHAFEQALDGRALAVVRALHDALAEEHRHFGYRVAREIARFVDLARVQTNGSEQALRAALDVVVLAKVLPKLHGSQGEMEEVLKRLLAIAVGAKSDEEVVGKDEQWIISGKDGKRVVALDAVPLGRSARKLARMLRRVRTRGFVSFIE